MPRREDRTSASLDINLICFEGKWVRGHIARYSRRNNYTPSRADLGKASLPLPPREDVTKNLLISLRDKKKRSIFSVALVDANGTTRIRSSGTRRVCNSPANSGHSQHARLQQEGVTCSARRVLPVG
jgi:hypothetical protein